jgi:hypothetical protein
LSNHLGDDEVYVTPWKPDRWKGSGLIMISQVDLPVSDRPLAPSETEEEQIGMVEGKNTFDPVERGIPAPDSGLCS